MDTITIEQPPKTQPAPGTDLTDAEIMAALKKYQDMAMQKGLLSGNQSPASPLGDPSASGPGNSQAQKVVDCIKQATDMRGQLDTIINTLAGTSVSSSPNSAPIKSDPALEAIATAMFADKTSEILKIDKDFPVEIVSKLSIPTADKIALMGAMKAVAERTKTAVETLRAEFAQKGNTQNPPVQANSGQTPGEPAGTQAKSVLSKYAEKFNATDLLATKPK